MKYTVYNDLIEITELQQMIMRYLDYWAHTEKSPIPKMTVIEEMKRKGSNYASVVHALGGLLRLGYIRRAVITSNKTYYVVLRRL